MSLLFTIAKKKRKNNHTTYTLLRIRMESFTTKQQTNQIAWFQSSDPVFVLFFAAERKIFSNNIYKKMKKWLKTTPLYRAMSSCRKNYTKTTISRAWIYNNFCGNGRIATKFHLITLLVWQKQIIIVWHRDSLKNIKLSKKSNIKKKVCETTFWRPRVHIIL